MSILLSIQAECSPDEARAIVLLPPYISTSNVHRPPPASHTCSSANLFSFPFVSVQPSPPMYYDTSSIENVWSLDNSQSSIAFPKRIITSACTCSTWFASCLCPQNCISMNPVCRFDWKPPLLVKMPSNHISHLYMDRYRLDNFNILFPKRLIQQLVIPFIRDWVNQICNFSQ